MRLFTLHSLLACGLAVTAAASARGGTVQRLSSEESEMVRIPSGAFPMGMPVDEEEEMYFFRLCVEDFGSHGDDHCTNRNFNYMRPAREVVLGEFYVDRREVSVDEYRECVRAGACDVGALVQGDQRYNQQEDAPMVNVTWDDAVSYCTWRGKRLPTEAEWEKAARGAEGWRWPWGNEWRKGAANHGQVGFSAENLRYVLQGWQGNSYATDDSDGFDYAAPPGSMPWGESYYGVQDMAGNVSEWVQDYFSMDGYVDLPAIDPLRDTVRNLEKRRVIRGGNWLSTRMELLVYERGVRTPSDRDSKIGFRCARSGS